MGALAYIALIIFAGFLTIVWLLLDFVVAFAMISLLIATMDFVSRCRQTVITFFGRMRRKHDEQRHPAMTADRSPLQG
jgi:hypothetical protein